MRPGTAAPNSRIGVVLGGSHLDQLHTPVKGAGKKDKAYFSWSLYKNRDQMTFAGVGQVLTLSHCHRLQAVALLHLLYLTETFFTPTLSISLCSS